jgi:hypothetical protein
MAKKINDIIRESVKCILTEQKKKREIKSIFTDQS